MKIFIDDERNPVEDGWTVVRTGLAYIAILNDASAPPITGLSFDHDLGDPKALDGYDLVKDTVVHCFDHPERFAPGMPIVIHTANPIGQKNMVQYLEFGQRHGAFTDSKISINYANMTNEIVEKP